MKKSFIPLLFILFIMVSCSTTGNHNDGLFLKKYGNEGDVVLTINNPIDRIRRINIEISDNEVFGNIEGDFSKLEASIALDQINLDDYGISVESYDFYKPGYGFVFFSSDNAKYKYNELISGDDIISEYDYLRLCESDIAVYSYHPNSDIYFIEKILLLSDKENMSFEFKLSDISKANGLLSSVKSSYLSYMIKNNISFNLNELSGHFILLDDIVYVNKLPLNGFVYNFAEEFLNYGR